jgi:hypothetical protein
MYCVPGGVAGDGAGRGAAPRLINVTGAAGAVCPPWQHDGAGSRSFPRNSSGSAENRVAQDVLQK